MTTTPTSPSSKKPSSNPLRAGQQLQGRYNLINRIATGGMGEVWRARDTRTGTLVAAKVLRPELTGEEISLSRLRIEAQNAMKAHHPNIAAVLDSGESSGQGWIVMELVQGDPLTDYVGDGKRLKAEELIPILSQTAFALDGAAQAGIIHRDIKPANIMVRGDGMVKLTDFGISYTDGQANLTAVGMVMGTAQYLAPEQAMGSVATHAGDLYSLGVIAYEALAGYRPFTGKSVVDIAMAHVNEEVPALPADVPEPLAEVVYSLLEKEPAERPASGTALVRILSRVADELGATTQPTPLTRPAKPVKATPAASAPEKKAQTPEVSPSRAATPPAPPRPSRRHSASSPVTPSSPSSARPSAAAAQSALPAAHPQAPGRRRPERWTGPTPTMSTTYADTEAPSGRREAVRPWHPVTGASIPASPAADRTVPEPPSPSASSHSPLPTRAQRHTDSANTIDWGLVGIVALVALTLILIVVAMLRDRPDSSADHFYLVPSAASTHLEVEPWLMPIPAY